MEYHVENEYALRDIHMVFSLKINKLVDYLSNMKIDKLHFWKYDSLNVLGWDELNAQFKGRMVPIKTDE